MKNSVWSARKTDIPTTANRSAEASGSGINRQVRPNFANTIYGNTTESSNAGSKVDVQLGSGSTTSSTVLSGGNSANSPSSSSSGGVQICESALAQRRSAYLPKLHQLSSNVTNLSFEHGSSRNEMGDIQFAYTDCDNFAAELSELYSYSEVTEWSTNLDSFLGYVRAKNLSPTWMSLEKSEKQAILTDLIQNLEHASPGERLEAARILLYILQGAFVDFEEPYSEVVADAMEEARSIINANNEEEFLESFCLLQAACNAYLAYESGIFKSLCEALLIEASEATEDHNFAPGAGGSVAERGASSLSNNARSLSSAEGDSRAASMSGGSRRSGTAPPLVCENEMFRVVLSCIYHIVESIRRPEVLAKCTHVSDYSASRLEQLQQQFVRELHEPIECVDKPLLVFLFDLLPPFIRGAVRIPIKKVLLLSWKTQLATLGGLSTLRDLKAKRRKEAGLPPVEDTLSVATKMRSTNFSASSESQFMEQSGTKIQRRYRGGIARAFNRQQALTSAGALSDDQSSSPRGDSQSSTATENLNENDEENGGSKAELESPTNVDSEKGVTPVSSDDTDPKTGNQNAPDPAGSNAGRDTPAPPPPAPSTLEENDDSSKDPRTPPNGQANAGELTPTASSPLPTNVLPWASKVRQCDIEHFIQNERLKFCGYKLPNDSISLFGLPPPVQKSVEALRRNLFTSLGELQLEEEKLLNKYPFSRSENFTETPVDQIYSRMIPNLPTDAICFLKILLAAIPSNKLQPKSETSHILSEVLTNRCPDTTTDLLSTSLNLDVSNSSSSNVLEDAVRLAIDINRHKEIIVKCCSALIINLLKLFRLSHVCMFENLAQQLVLTNCLPLILKFLDQNMVKYFQSKNELTPLSYPHAVVYYARNKREWPVLSADNVGVESVDNQSYFMWRNVFSSINLLRVLNKLTKNKHSRTMMLVVFKSTPILKRCLKLRSGIFQFYTLKLLKMQARYLGRQWRRTNMEVISAIYMKLRHRLNDDWAFANETRCKSWDFQAEERELKMSIERFNNRRYGHLYPEMVFQVNVKDSISGVAGANAGKMMAGENPNGEHDYNVNNDGNDPQSSDDQDRPADDSQLQDPELVELQPVDNNLMSVLGERVEFTPYFKRNYEKWLEDAVFRRSVDWDAVLMPSEELEATFRKEEETQKV